MTRTTLAIFSRNKKQKSKKTRRERLLKPKPRLLKAARSAKTLRKPKRKTIKQAYSKLNSSSKILQNLLTRKLTLSWTKTQLSSKMPKRLKRPSAKRLNKPNTTFTDGVDLTRKIPLPPSTRVSQKLKLPSTPTCSSLVPLAQRKQAISTSQKAHRRSKSPKI